MFSFFLNIIQPWLAYKGCHLNTIIFYNIYSFSTLYDYTFSGKWEIFVIFFAYKKWQIKTQFLKIRFFNLLFDCIDARTEEAMNFHTRRCKVHVLDSVFTHFPAGSIV